MIDKEEMLKAFDSPDNNDRERLRLQFIVLLDIREFLKPVIEGHSEIEMPPMAPGEIKGDV